MVLPARRMKYTEIVIEFNHLPLTWAIKALPFPSFTIPPPNVDVRHAKTHPKNVSKLQGKCIQIVFLLL
jgi:hypothetical protein